MSVAEVAARQALDLGLLLGDWRNTNPAGGIARIVCERSGDDRLLVRCHSAVREWGTVEAPVFAFAFDDKKAAAFSAVFDFGFEEVRLQVNVKAGVLVVASFNRFRDGSGRSGYFDREFFYRLRP